MFPYLYCTVVIVLAVNQDRWIAWSILLHPTLPGAKVIELTTIADHQLDIYMNDTPGKC